MKSLSFRFLGSLALISIPLILICGCSSSKNKQVTPEIKTEWNVTDGDEFESETQEIPGDDPARIPTEEPPTDGSIDPADLQEEITDLPLDDPFYPPEIRKIKIYRNKQVPKCPYKTIGFVRAQNLDAGHAESMLKVKVNELGGHGAVDVKWFTFDTDKGEETWLLGTAFVFTNPECTDGW